MSSAGITTKLRAAAVMAAIWMSTGGHARAEPARCATLDADRATEVARLLPRGSRVLYYCQPCGDQQPGPWEIVDEVAIVGSGTDARYVRINGKPVTLGWTYYLAADGTARDVALQVGCPAEGVSQVLTLAAPSFPTRRYKLGLTIEVMSSKDDGRAWDPGGGLPDPVIRGGLFQGGQMVKALTCVQQDTLTSTCLDATVIEANEDTVLSLAVADKDALEDDDIGTVAASLREAIERPGKPITLRGVKGQIKSATLWLTPIE